MKKILAGLLIALAVVAVLMVIWSPWFWQSLITAVVLFIVSAGVSGTPEDS